MAYVVRTRVSCERVIYINNGFNTESTAGQRGPSTAFNVRVMSGGRRVPGVVRREVWG